MPGDNARDRSTLWAILAVVGGLAVMFALTLYNERRDAAAAAPAPRVEHETASAASYACQLATRTLSAVAGY